MRKHVQEEDANPTLEPTAGDRGQNYGNRRRGTSSSLRHSWLKFKEDLKNQEGSATQPQRDGGRWSMEMTEKTQRHLPYAQDQRARGLEVEGEAAAGVHRRLQPPQRCSLGYVVNLYEKGMAFQTPDCIPWKCFF